MALPVETQVKYWGIATAVFLLIMWALGDVILPFVLGAALAYCLDPIADWLENHGFSRGWATGIITFFATLIFVIAALLIVPMLLRQATELIAVAPEMATNLQTFLVDRFPELGDANSTIRRSLASLGSTIQSRGDELLNAVLSSFSGLVNIIVLFVIVPVTGT
ncbi:MAG: AI-2E family transporter, partial [Pseudomonadota bacterium]